MTLSPRITSSPSNRPPRRNADRFLMWSSRLAALIAATIVLLVIVFLVLESQPALRTIGIERFLTDESWHPLSGRFNLAPMLVATALTSLGAMLIAAPLGLGSAVFACFFAPPRWARWHRRLVELLAGIPSVVYGLWGLVVLVPILAPLGGSGQGLLTATLILALMILPTVALTAEAALTGVPRDVIQHAAALGLGRWAIARRVAIPAASGGIGTGLMLAAARAVGETMAVLMVAGNVVEMPRSIVDPVRTLTANIALEMGYATADHRSVLFVSGLLLMLAVALAVFIAEVFGHRSRRRNGTAEQGPQGV